VPLGIRALTSKIVPMAKLRVSAPTARTAVVRLHLGEGPHTPRRCCANEAAPRRILGAPSSLCAFAHVESADVKAGVRPRSQSFCASMRRSSSDLLPMRMQSFARIANHPARAYGMLSAIAPALPAAFTLVAALGAKHPTLRGVLLTRCRHCPRTTTINVLCADKTGTLTENKIVGSNAVSAQGAYSHRCWTR
jgi:hypothetical protein